MQERKSINQDMCFLNGSKKMPPLFLCTSFLLSLTTRYRPDPYSQDRLNNRMTDLLKYFSNIKRFYRSHPAIIAFS